MNDQAPRRRADGFLERGHQVTRIEAFVDAAFAFAVTLLVISDGVPTDIDTLMLDLRRVPGMLCSFAMIAMFWFAHNKWSRRFGLDDTGSVVLSLMLVFLVLIYVYPLRMMFGSFFGWLSHLLLPTEAQLPWMIRIDGFDDIADMFIVYGVAWSSLGSIIALLYRRADRQWKQLGLDHDERAMTAGEFAAWLMVPASGLLSIGIAIALPSKPPMWAAGAPGFAYFSMFATGLVASWATARKRLQLAGERG